MTPANAPAPAAGGSDAKSRAPADAPAGPATPPPAEAVAAAAVPAAEGAELAVEALGAEAAAVEVLAAAAAPDDAWPQPMDVEAGEEAAEAEAEAEAEEERLSGYRTPPQPARVLVCPGAPVGPPLLGVPPAVRAAWLQEALAPLAAPQAE